MSTIEKAAARLVKRRTSVASSQNALENGKTRSQLADSPAFESPNELGELPEMPANSGSLHERSDDVSRYCELDFPWLEENGFLVPNHTNQKQGQEFRRIKRPLLLNLQPGIAKNQKIPTNIIYVTSALPGEGKTFVSLNLALSLAGEVDHSVLLIDGDAAKGDLSRWLGIYGEQGLVDSLAQQSSAVGPITIATNVDRLSVMACGKRTDNLDELYSSEVMTDLVGSLAGKNSEQIVVIDGPPLLPTTEAAVLAGLMGQTILVVEANKTPQSAVEQAIQRLEGSQLVSAMLNKVSSSQSESYGYGYAYGRGSEDGESMSAGSK